MSPVEDSAPTSEASHTGAGVPVYAINLERSRDRWERLSASAKKHGLDLRRVDAVEGKLLRPDQLGDFDEQSFRLWHGKMVLPAEIGCYFSHFRALEQFLADGGAHAVIIEDDVIFTDDYQGAVGELVGWQGWDAVKFVNHRVKGFRPAETLGSGLEIGRTMHGPSGSSAAYMVTREGARRLLAALKPMFLPMDVALERGWAGGYEIFTTGRAVVDLSEAAVSTIADGRATYINSRLPVHKRLGTLAFRASDYARRIAYALRPSTLRRGN